MKAPHRIFATAAAGAIAAAALTGCASGTPEERAQALAEDFVAWVIEDIYMAGENPSEEHKETAVREDPFDGICEGALEDVTSEISWISLSEAADTAELVKTEGDAGSETFWFVVGTTREDGTIEGQDLPVRVSTVDGDLCVDASATDAEVRD
ncbi:hypothetical protein [Microbacterium sp.]|uniref:hypothetical protein n=1 Tax=Microbacterium sp. TaxID=51671 RepID=UPI00263378A9|nr:hypothetical protein [Microbacterium sp.]